MPKEKLYWRLAAVLWMGLIWWLSNQPDLRTSLEQDFVLRKIAHMFEFGILTWLLAKSLESRHMIVLAAASALLYAGLDEVHQSWVVGRHGTWHDVLIDAVGIITVSGLLFWRSLRRSRRVA